MPLSASRATRSRETSSRTLLIKTGVVIFAGGIVVNDAGKAAPGRVVSGLIAMGVADHDIDNQTGSLDGEPVKINTGCFGFKNSLADPVDDSDAGKQVFIEDDETISATDDGGARSPAGILYELEDGRAWVIFG